MAQSKNEEGEGFATTLRKVIDQLRDASARYEKEENKSTASATEAVDNFVRNLRNYDVNTKRKIAETVNSQDFRDKIDAAVEANKKVNLQDISEKIDMDIHNQKKNNNQIELNYVNPLQEGIKNLYKYGQYLERDAKERVKSAIDQKIAEDKANQQSSEPTANEEELVEYTYKPGDTFGEVLMKMGLSDGRNLWGPEGDVNYYRQQLHEQGLYGNIPIGQTIRLRRRK